MKKLIIATLLGVSLFSMMSATKRIQAESVPTSSEVKTIVVGEDETGNNSKSRVYQLTYKTMKITNRTMAIFDNNGLQHWHAKKVTVNGKQWWKVGENQYFKPERVAVVNTDRMSELGMSVTNYANYTDDENVSMINEF